MISILKMAVMSQKFLAQVARKVFFCLASGDYFDYSSIVTENFDFLICPNLRLDFKGNNHI